MFKLHDEKTECQCCPLVNDCNVFVHHLCINHNTEILIARTCGLQLLKALSTRTSSVLLHTATTPCPYPPSASSKYTYYAVQSALPLAFSYRTHQTLLCHSTSLITRLTSCLMRHPFPSKTRLINPIPHKAQSRPLRPLHQHLKLVETDPARSSPLLILLLHIVHGCEVFEAVK